MTNEILERAPSAVPAASRGEAGFTLIEMLVAMGVMLVVFSAVVVTLVGFNSQTNSTTSRVTSLDSANASIERIAREIRQATFSSTAPYGLTVSGSGATLSFYLEERQGGTGTAALHNVTYTCSANASPSTYANCKRTDTTCATLPCTPAPAVPANATSTATLVDGLTSTQVFGATGATGATGPISGVRVTLAPAITGSSLPAVLQETVIPRSCQIGGC